MACGRTDCAGQTRIPESFETAPALPRDGLLRLLQRLDTWRVRSRQRRQLARLDDAQLDDVGLTREQAREECRKPFWQE